MIIRARATAARRSVNTSPAVMTNLDFHPGKQCATGFDRHDHAHIRRSQSILNDAIQRLRGAEPLRCFPYREHFDIKE
jgi:hypothetical protein